MPRFRVTIEYTERFSRVINEDNEEKVKSFAWTMYKAKPSNFRMALSTHTVKCEKLRGKEEEECTQ
jgi:hypothetical protein